MIARQDCPEHVLKPSISRAICDPAKVLPRAKVEGPLPYEDLPHWQIRAVLSVVEPFLAAQREQVEKLRAECEQLIDEQQQIGSAIAAVADGDASLPERVEALVDRYHEARAEVARLCEERDRWQNAWRRGDRAWAEDRTAAWRAIQAWEAVDGESTRLGTTTQLDQALHALRLQLSADDATGEAAEVARLRAQSDTGQDFKHLSRPVSSPADDTEGS